MVYFAFILFTLLVLILAFYQWQYFAIFSPTYYRSETLPHGAEIVEIITKDAKALEGVVYTPELIKSRMLFFAGRSHDVVGLIEKLSLTYLSTQIIAFNYRSYGKSEGKINEKRLYSDALEIAEIIEKNYGDFYLLGFSLGSSIAAYVASKKAVKGLFLVGAFDSIASLARTKYKLAKPLRYKFKTEQYVANVDAKTYLFVSKDDEVTYIKNARALKDKIKNLATYMELERLTHKEILWDERVVARINEEMM
ncbi:MAG: alpha/beta fold hydrolase [Campylobacterales bacterium]|nr:alpha/beta fold hydrolase [Campylobacterales bacterium]